MIRSLSILFLTALAISTTKANEATCIDHDFAINSLPVELVIFDPPQYEATSSMNVKCDRRFQEEKSVSVLTINDIKLPSSDKEITVDFYCNAKSGKWEVENSETKKREEVHNVSCTNIVEKSEDRQ